MNRLTQTFACCVAAGALLAGTAAQAGAKRTGEERLARMLEGRVAGEPQSCIPTMATHSVTVIDKTAIVYKAGGTLYVNRTANPKDLSSNEVLVIERMGHQLCNTDMVTTRSQGSPSFFTGSIFLGQFVPYKKAGSEG